MRRAVRVPWMAGVGVCALAPLVGAAPGRAHAAADAGAGDAAPVTRVANIRSVFPTETPRSVDALGAMLAGGDSRGATLCELAALGADGRAAGPAVAELLAHPDWTTRVNAARTLGYIGYAGAVTPLIAALRSDENWQLVLTSAESLGRLKSAAAVDALRAIEQHHWYPPVREAARKAGAAIAGREAYRTSIPGQLFPIEFFDYDRAGSEVPACPASGKRGTRSFGPDRDLQRARARSMTYDARAAGQAAGREHRWETPDVPSKQRPNAALEIDGTWLLGADRGDQGGELVAVDAGRHATLVRDGNVQAIARLGARVVALCGESNLGTNSGVVYEVARDAAGAWAARPWRVLPGAPLGSTTQPDGSWLIHTNGGSVVLAADGSLAMARCAPPKK